MTAVVMFGFRFLFDRKFAKHCGSSARGVFTFQLGCNICGLTVVFIACLVKNGIAFLPGFSLFTLIMAVLYAANSIAYTMCSLKSLGSINLSTYSVFSMLGGMVMPFLLGIIFFDERIGVGKILSAMLIIAALAVTVKPGGKNSGYGWYAGVFLLNGMSGVISKLYQSGHYRKADELGFLFVCASVSALISFTALCFIKGEKKKPDGATVFNMGVSGVLSCFAYLILLISLSHVPASAQYPLVTGGVMAVSTLISCFTDSKPGVREYIALALSVLGIFAMILL